MSVHRVVVMLFGPQASGKSTVARALAETLRREGHSVALVELDQIAAMGLPTLPSWDDARRIFALVTGEWARSSMSFVLAEGLGSTAEVESVARHIPAGVTRVTAAITTSFEDAFARAQKDPTRGISRDRDFLRGAYDRWSVELISMTPTVIIDTSQTSVADATSALRAAVEAVH